MDDAVDVVFAGLDRGMEGEVEQRYERSLPLAEALGAKAILVPTFTGKTASAVARPADSSA